MSQHSGTVAVTGASGFIGGRLVGVLGGSARALVRKPVPWLAGHQIEIDLLDESADLARALHGARTVVHLAGHNEVVAAHEPDRALADSVVMASRVADAAAKAGVGRLVYLSTVHVYGVQLTPGATIDETVVPEPRAAYAIARLASEHVSMTAADAGLDVAVLRLTNAIGAPADPEVDRWTLVAQQLCREAALAGTLTLRSSGQQWRDFVGVGDVCRVLADIATAPTPLRGTFNAAAGHSATVRSLACLIAERFEQRTGARPVLHAHNPQGPEPEPYTVSTRRLGAAGYRLDTALVDAIDELVAFCLANRERLAAGAR